MAYLILNDIVDYETEHYPTYIIAEDLSLVPVFIGANSVGQEKEKGKTVVGIWVKEEDYLKINHKKAYILVHNPDAQDSAFKDIKWDDIEDVENEREANRTHYHVRVTRDGETN